MKQYFGCGLIDQEKVERYRLLLGGPFWEICEASYFLLGQIDFVGFYNLEPEIQLRVKRERIGLIPEEFLEEHTGTQFDLILKSLLQFALKDTSEVISEKLRFIRRSNPIHSILEQHSFFLRPEDVLAIALTEGFILPFELQEASSLYQLGKNFRKLTTPNINKLKRSAVIQFLLHKNPGMSNGAVCREMVKLRIENPERFDFLRQHNKYGYRVNSGFKKERQDINLVSKSISNIPLVRNLFEECDGKVLFDFQSLKEVLRVVCDLIQQGGKIQTKKDILSHQLINDYIQRGGESIRKIITFCLRDFIENLNCYYISEI